MDLILDPKWKWAAQVDAGIIFLFTHKPIFDESSGCWERSSARCGVSRLPCVNDLGAPEDSLHQIVDGKLVKFVDIPADGEPVIVWRNPEHAHKRYSTGKTCDGALRCYADGADKWSGSRLLVTNWQNWRRPTPEELAE